MLKKKPCGYYWRCFKDLKRFATPNYVVCDNEEKRIFSYSFKQSDFIYINPKRTKWIVKHAFDFKKIYFVLLFFAVGAFAFNGVGDCQKLLADYAQLTNKSVFLPHLLDGQCVIHNEKHIPYILKSAGYSYVEKSGYLQIKPIEPIKEKPPEVWQPEDKYYDIEFYFVNTSSAMDCGLRMDEIIATLHNLDYAISLGVSLGCPALDYDGSFAFKTNAHLVETWTFTHGIETQRQRAQITSSTGAVTNEYDYITTGLNITLYQTPKGVSFSIKYTGSNGSVTTSTGGLVKEVRATTTDEYTRTRKFWAFPVGKEKIHAQYTLIMRTTPSSSSQ